MSSELLGQVAARHTLDVEVPGSNSRTIADLSGEPDIGLPHVAEALQYRPTSFD